MIDQTFEKGNYNAWEKFVNVSLPSANIKIRRDIIPSIDEALISMLGKNAKIHKNTVDILQVIDGNNLSALECHLIYDVEDFHVPQAPDKAIKTDTDNLTDALTREDANLSKLEIDVSQGKLLVQYIIPLLED